MLAGTSRSRSKCIICIGECHFDTGYLINKNWKLLMVVHWEQIPWHSHYKCYYNQGQGGKPRNLRPQSPPGGATTGGFGAGLLVMYAPRVSSSQWQPPTGAIPFIRRDSQSKLCLARRIGVKKCPELVPGTSDANWMLALWAHHALAVLTASKYGITSSWAPWYM